MSVEFKSHRTRLNGMSTFVSAHPLPYVVHSWTIPQDSQITKLESPREIIWVNNLSKLIKRCDNIIQNDSVIGIDSVFDRSLFHDVIAILQIPCCHIDFVLDSFLLFPFLKVKLVPILQSSKIVKLIFIEKYVRNFIRDYEMYFVGCVDLQDVFASYLREKNLYNILDKISLSKAVKLTLSIGNTNFICGSIERLLVKK
jgi:hypothetical protein